MCIEIGMKARCIIGVLCLSLLLPAAAQARYELARGIAFLVEKGGGKSAREILTELRRPSAQRARHLEAIRGHDPQLAAQVERQLAHLSTQDLERVLSEVSTIRSRIPSDTPLFQPGMAPIGGPDWRLHASAHAHRAVNEHLALQDLLALPARGARLGETGVTEADRLRALEIIEQVMETTIERILREELHRARLTRDRELKPQLTLLQEALADQARLLRSLKLALAEAPSAAAGNSPQRVVYEPDTDSLVVQPIAWGPVGIGKFTLQGVRKKLLAVGAAAGGYAVAEIEGWFDERADSESQVDAK